MEIVATILFTTGIFFALTGSVGIIRMPDFYSRLHAAGKTDSLAQLLIILGLVFHTVAFILATPEADLLAESIFIGKLALLSGLLFVTSPTATHAITKAAYLDGLRPWTAPEKKADSPIEEDDHE